MIIDSSNKQQQSILTNKTFYQTTAKIMSDFEAKGYANSADETNRVISAYHEIVKKKSKNNYNKDYNNAFNQIDDAIKNLANKVFYNYSNKNVDHAYQAFEQFDHISAIVNRQRTKKHNP